MPEPRIVTSPAERLKALEVAYAGIESPEPFALYAAVRLRVPRRHEGDWWLLENAGDVVSALMCYPLDFHTGDQIVPGYGLGAVATHPDRRRRGHATTLCRAAIEASGRAGRPIGLLYSAIAPALYERLGFRVLPGAGQFACADLDALADSGPRAELEPMDATARMADLLALYDRHHTGLRIARDEREMRRSLVRNYEDVFLALGDPLHGYVRLYLPAPAAVEVVECLAPPAERAEALRAVADLARRGGRRRLVSWLQPPPCLAEHFEDEGRALTLPMVRGHAALEEAHFGSADYF